MMEGRGTKLARGKPEGSLLLCAAAMTGYGVGQLLKFNMVRKYVQTATLG